MTECTQYSLPNTVDVPKRLNIARIKKILHRLLRACKEYTRAERKQMVKRVAPKLMALSLVVALALMAQSVSGAKSVGFRANGKVLWYGGIEPPSEPGSSVVVGGNWNIRAKDGDVDFELFYREENLIPEEEGGAPAGSVDHFTVTLVTLEYLDYVPGEYCIIMGYFNVDKLAWLPEGSTPPKDHIYNFLGGPHWGWVYVHAEDAYDPTYMETEFGPWHLWCSVTSMT